MINLGMPICHSGKNYKKKINSYLKTISDNVLLLTVEKETVKKGPSIFDIMQTKLRYGVIVHLDTMLDKWIRNNTVDVNKINVTSLLQSVGAPVNALGCVTTWFETQRSELIEARDKKCSQIVEAYSHLSKPAIKRRIKLLDEMLLDVDVYRSSKKSSRKPRVKKQKSADKLVKSLKYLKSSSEYGIVSTNPMKLIGSEKAYIFNEKYRRLTVLVQSDKNGLMVKGTTILDFHDDESYSTTLRKPKEILSAISTKTERQITNIMNKLTTKKNKANGRVSSNTLIVKA